MIYELSDMHSIERHAISLTCCNSYLHYHQSSYYQLVTDSILSHTQGKWDIAIKWFVTSVARAFKSNAEGFRISLDPSYYTGNKAKIGFRAVKQLLEFLEQKSYIHIYKGFVETWKVENGKRVPEYVVKSCVVFRKRLIELWNSSKVPIHLFEEKALEDSVIVRNRKTGEEMGTRGKVGIKEARVKMDQYNESLKGADIKYMGKKVATVAYKRIFLDTMNIAGRLYAAGGGIQIMEQRLRSQFLMIDNEPVVELDYHAIHPSICYQMLYNDGVSAYDLIGQDFSPYGADLSFVEVDEKEVQRQSDLLGKKYDPRRNLVKLAILIGINSLDSQQAVGALSGKVKDDHKKEQEDKLFVGVVGTVPVRKILDAVKEHNDLIAENFYSDKGVVLQKVDSDIMMSIVQTMVQKGHTVLSYHDSCLCKASAEDDLREAMYSAWKEVLGDTTFCKVDKK